MAKKNRGRKNAKPIRKRPPTTSAARQPKRSRLPTLIGGAIAIVAAAYGVYHFGFANGYRGPVKHVIIISLDTTRPDHFGCYGNTEVKTPNIDALAKESILFTDAMTVVPTTLASHASLFSGKHPHNHGTPRNGHLVNTENVMLAEILKDAGFHTAGFLGSFALDSRFHFNQGFDYYEDDKFDQLAGVDVEAAPDQDQRRAKAVTDSVIQYLDEKGVPDNLFLFAHYFDAHAPYDPPAPYFEMYKHPQDPGGLLLYPFVRWRLNQHPEAEHPAAAALRQRYKGEISYQDEHVGRLIADLKRRGILDESILILISDHGENLDEHYQYLDHGFSVYQTTMRIACMIRLPKGLHGGKRIDDLVANIDILPTLLTYMGLPLPEGMDGDVIDLAGATVPFAPRASFGEATKPPVSMIETDPRWTNILKARCIREGNYKYVQVPYPMDLGIPLSPEALFDLDSDPMEQNNLLEAPTPEIQAIAADLKAKLDKWAVSGRPLPTHYDSSQRDDTMRRLGGLGYVYYDGERTTFRQAQQEESKRMKQRMESMGYADALRDMPATTPRRRP
ncbi:MAG: sulfatase [Planctomycetes bacterium]|nr:sulfatase [Planctomycetota bacterium]